MALALFAVLSTSLAAFLAWRAAPLRPAWPDWRADAARPAVRLLPEAPLARASGHEWMSFLAATVHIAFRPLFRPQYLIGDQSLYPKLRETGIPNLQRTLAEVELEHIRNVLASVKGNKTRAAEILGIEL